MASASRALVRQGQPRWHRPRWHRCASLRAGGRACWHRVDRRGDRCDRCWTELAASPAITDRAELAAEAELPGWVAELLAVDMEAMVRVLVAERSGVEAALLRRLAADRDASVRAAAAGNPGLPADALAALVDDADPVVAVALARRDDTDPAVLDRLANHPDRRVRGAVAANPATIEATERRLACQERDLTVLAALAAKPSTAPVVRGWLARHPSPAVAGRARSPGLPSTSTRLPPGRDTRDRRGQR